ncbi:MAG: hypothetical protein P8N23_05075 [Methylophilaceae bacterium]|nr:hypothetical protein [Methylophilaceae bacterium]
MIKLINIYKYIAITKTTAFGQSIDTLFIYLYFTLLMYDKFDAILILSTLFIFINIKVFFKILNVKPEILLLPVISFLAFLHQLIPESKFYIIYFFSFYVGSIICVNKSFNLIRFRSFFSVMTLMLLVPLIFAWLLNAQLNLSVEENINNYAEVLVFFNLCQIYMKSKGDESNQFSKLFSFLSGSKFLILSTWLFDLRLRYFISLILMCLIYFIIFNPFEFLSSRFTLYELFFKNIKLHDLLFGQLTSVNTLVYDQQTIYSFHNIFMDFIWLGGFVGFIWAYILLKDIFHSFLEQNSEVNKKIIFIFFICIFFGFSIFFGTKFMFFFYGIIFFSGNKLGKLS